MRRGVVIQAELLAGFFEGRHAHGLGERGITTTLAKGKEKFDLGDVSSKALCEEGFDKDKLICE